jgi:hypothetical protein
MIRASIAISCACGGIVGGWLGYMASERDVPVKYYSTEIVNTPAPGSVLRAKSVVWRDKSCDTTIYRLVFDKDGRRHIVPDLQFAPGVLPVGNDTFVAPVPISPEASPGEATYRAVRRYRCNWLHWIWPVVDGPFDYPFTIAAPQR